MKAGERGLAPRPPILLVALNGLSNESGAFGVRRSAFIISFAVLLTNAIRSKNLRRHYER
jgi:hypothetical protein